MRILYLCEDPTAEFHEVKLFTNLGHEVFSIGEQSLGTPPGNRLIQGYEVNAELVEKFKELHPNYQEGGPICLNKGFTGEFDVIVVSNFPSHLTMNWKIILEKTVIWVWRTRPRATPIHYKAVKSLRGKGLKVLELPPTGTYKVDECKKLWTNLLRRIQGF